MYRPRSSKRQLNQANDKRMRCSCCQQPITVPGIGPIISIEPIWVRGKTVAERACGRGWRRADAAHQGECAPEGEPTAALVGTGPLDHTGAIRRCRISLSCRKHPSQRRWR